MDSLRALLAIFHTDHRHLDFTAPNLADELGRVEVREIVSDHIFDRNDGLAAVLRHEQKSGVEGRRVGGCFVHEIDASADGSALKRFW